MIFSDEIGLRYGKWLLAGAGLLAWSLASAYTATYQGLLISGKPADAPIPIVINLDVGLAGVSGDVATAFPREGRGVVIGEEGLGTCSLRSLMSDSMVLKMKGACGIASPTFEGKYSLLLKDGKKQEGSFKLSKTRMKKGPFEGESTGARKYGSPSASSTTHCINANRACLLSCPRGDYNAEFLCVNRCKKKLRVCKAKPSSVPPIEKPLEPPTGMSR